MPIAVACPKCQKKYNLPDNMMGRQVKCPACGSPFQVPARKQPVVDPRQAAVQQKKRAEMQQREMELRKMGVAGTIQRAPDVFEGLPQMQGTADPLANYQIEDPGFAEVNYTRTETTDINDSDDPMAGMFENPAIEKSKKKKTKKRKNKKTESPYYLEPWFWFTALFLPLYGLLALLCWTQAISYDTALILGVTTLALNGLASIALGVFGIILIYRNTPSVAQVLLCWFIPFYLFYYLSKHWEPMKSFGNALLAQALISMVSLPVFKMLEKLEEMG